MRRDSRPSRILGPESAKGLRFGIIVSRFHEGITSNLLMVALGTLKEHGCNESDIDHIDVPGAFEIPFAAQKLAESLRYDAIICLGCVIRGETPHFDYICQWVSQGIGQVSLETSVPTIFGVITANTLEQAVARSADNAVNQGAHAALTAIEMAGFMQRLRRDE